MFSHSKIKLPVVLGLALGGTALGFFVGRQYPADDAVARNNTTSAAMSTRMATAHPHPGALSVARAAPADISTADRYERWRALANQPSTPATEDQMALCLRELGARDFAAALTLAQEARTPRQREVFRNAALQGWATHDISAATTWVLSHVGTHERRAAIEAVAAGSVAHPAQAIAAFQQLIANDPLLASDHGHALIRAFVYEGKFKTASAFAAAGLAQYRAAWLSNVYHEWAASQPEAALAGIEKLADPAARHEALSAVFAGWGSSDPAALVAYAQHLPAGDSRLAALQAGLTQWVYRDPTAASDWMDQRDPSPDLDAGAAAIAVMPTLVLKKPEIAASWAESITDPEMRSSTLLDLIRLWAERDAAGAHRYASTSPALDPTTRALALATLPPNP